MVITFAKVCFSLPGIELKPKFLMRVRCDGGNTRSLARDGDAETQQSSHTQGLDQRP